MEHSVLFLDDDPVVRLVRLLVQKEISVEDGRWAANYFLPESRPEPDVNPFQALKAFRDSLGLPAIQPILAANLPNDEVLRSAQNVSAVIFRRGEITGELLAAAPRLRLVQRFGPTNAGIKVNPSDYPHVHFCLIPRFSLAATAEHTLLLMLALGKQLLQADQRVRAGHEAIPGYSGPGGVTYNWAGVPSVTPLVGKTLGILGLGEVGYQLAVRAKAMGMNILYHNRRRLPEEKERELKAAYRSKEQLAAESDFLSVLVTPPKDSGPLLGAPEFALMKKGAYLINTSRGNTIDQKALVQFLTNGHLAGAGLDVFDPEPINADDPLTKLPNVILTPHIAAGQRTLVNLEVQDILANLALALNGKRPKYILTPDGGYQ